MRIAIISDLSHFSWAGCEELWAALARKALEDGNSVAFFPSRQRVLSTKIQPLQEMGLQVFFPNARIRIVDGIRKKFGWRLGSIAARWFPLFGQLKKFAPDVVFITAGEAIPRPEFLSDLDRSGALTIPYVIACHSSFLFGRPLDLAAQKRAARYYLGARHVLFVANRTHKEAEHLLATTLPRVTIVRNPVNIASLTPMPMPSGPTVRIATLGRLTMHTKGQDLLLAALGSPQFRDRDWILSIYGHGPHLENLKHLAEHYQIADRIQFKGHTQDVRAIWAENHLHVLPSRNESAPLVVVEAMLCGRPSVANDVGGVREWVIEPETGFVSDGIDIDSFRSALDRAWLALADWDTIGKRANQKALDMLDPDPGGKILALLQNIPLRSPSSK